MAVYYRPYLFEFLYLFVSGEKRPDSGPDLSKLELALFTKGTKDYAEPIIKDILTKFKAKYQLSQA